MNPSESRRVPQQKELKIVRRLLTWKTVLIVAGCFVFFAGLVLRYAEIHQSVRRWGSWRQAKAVSLVELGEAFIGYSMMEREVPEPLSRDHYGAPCSSWRFNVVRYLRYARYPISPALPWYHPENHFWAAHALQCFCPQQSQPAFDTDIVAVTGNDTAFDEGYQRHSDSISKSTIVCIQIAESGIHWMMPGDLDVDQVSPAITCGEDGTGVFVLFADGQTWFLDKTVPRQELKKFFTVKEASEFDREACLGPYCKLRHPEKNSSNAQK